MFGFGKSKKCEPCSASQMPEQQFFPTVPMCPGETPYKANGCITNEGKFYDRILHDLIIPISGQDVKAYVCDPKLWSACQWMAICYQNTIAVFKVIGLGSDHILLVNACQDGQPIEDNPPPGTKVNAKSVIYPVPPPWCSQALCNKITNALSDPECACQGVLNCLANSEEVCLSSIPSIEDGEELHLFGGTMLTNEGNENNNPSLWKSCVKKIWEIFTGFSGKTICFADIPETTADPDIVDGSPVSKRYAFIDGFGCLRKGPIVTSGGCDEELDIVESEDEYHTGDDEDTKGRTFDAVKVCRDGVERILLPGAGCQAIFSIENEDNEKFWEIQPAGGRMFFFDTAHVLSFGVNTALKDYDKYIRLAGQCKLFAIVSATEGVSYSSTNGGTPGLSANGVSIGQLWVNGGGTDIFTQPNAIIPLTEDKITLARIGTVGAGVMASQVYRLRGYMVGGGEA